MSLILFCLTVCLTEECALAASRVLEGIDQSVNPCDDFYMYACGNWKKTHVIPEDKSSLSVFGVLRDQVQVINKGMGGVWASTTNYILALITYAQRRLQMNMLTYPAGLEV